MPKMNTSENKKLKASWDPFYKFITDSQSDRARRKRVYTKLDKLGGHE